MTRYSDLPLYMSSHMHRVPEHVYGEAVRNVHQLLGPLEDEEAMRIVDAVISPLRLVSPKPSPADFTMCDHSYFTYAGQWLFCNVDHSDPDSGEHVHAGPDPDTQSWDDMDLTGRAFEP